MQDKELKPFREAKVLELDHICPICKNKREKHEFVVDHKHKTKTETNGVNGAGMIRGVICFKCNSAEGRMLSKFKRSGLHKDTDFADFLRTLADYLELETTNLIHPTEKVKVKPLMKRPFNKIKKLHDIKYPRRKKLEYPKSGKPTKMIVDLAKEFDIEL